MFKKFLCWLLKHNVEEIGTERGFNNRKWTLYRCRRCGKGFKTAYRIMPHPVTFSLIDVEEWNP